jgi:hypothetical protein
MRHALALFCAFSATCAIAQPPAPITRPSASAGNALASTIPASTIPASTIKDLPVHQVILYKNGIGYFEHSGTVTGNQHVAIDFTSSQLNDVLQSLTILDENGGHIGGVNYNSTSPLAEQLKSLSLAMTDDPTSTQLFQALRGQRVEVTGAGAGTLTGRLMSIESRSEKTASGEATNERIFLSLVTTGGAIRVIELTPSLSVRPLDASLQNQLDRYLELLSSAHSTGLRHLTLNALGQGPRQLRVSYISEVPVWKSTYRIVFPRDSTSNAILQGWAVVDNTIGSDWDNVQLSLVAGAPQSFIQPLSQPLYLRRPEIAISTTAMTTPQTHEAADMAVNGQNLAQIEMGANVNAGPPLSFGTAAMGGSGAGAVGGVIGSLFGSANPASTPVSAGVGGNVGGGLRKVGKGEGVGGGVFAVSSALQEGDVNTNTFDDFFQYNLAQPVTIHKNESAMVPILQESLPAERVTLWSQGERTPFRAIWLENTSKLTFDRGSFSIFESGVFAGQGLLDPIHPGEKRLLSYAADQAIRVKQHPEEGKREIRSVRITARGFVKKTYAAESRMTYDAVNSAEDARVVIIEVPRRPNRNLSPESKAAETAPSLYRFRLPVASHQTTSILVADEGPDYENWQIQEDTDQVAVLQSLAEEVPALQDKIKPLITAQQEINEMKAHIHALDQKSAALTNDEARARENLTALKGNDAAKRFVEELNQAEDNLQSTQNEIASQSANERAAVESLRQTLLTIDINWTSPSISPAAH